MSLRSLGLKLLRGVLFFVLACVLFAAVLVAWEFLGLPDAQFRLLGVPTVLSLLVPGAAVALVFGLIKGPRAGLWLGYGAAFTLAAAATVVMHVGNRLPYDQLWPVAILIAWSPFIGGLAGTLAVIAVRTVYRSTEAKAEPPAEP